MSLWYLYRGLTTEKTIASGQPILSALLHVATDAMANAADAGNAAGAALMRSRALSTPAHTSGLDMACRIAADTVRTCHRTLGHALTSGVQFRAFPWPNLWTAVLALARAVGSSEEMLRVPEATAIAAPLFSLLSLVIARGADLGVSEFEELAQSIAIHHPQLCRLLRAGRAAAPTAGTGAEPFLTTTPIVKVRACLPIC